jgi:hypothetical protein
VDAALAYDQAAREYHKDKAQLNFPDLPPQPQVGWSMVIPSQAASDKTSRHPTSRYRGESSCIWARTFAFLNTLGHVSHTRCP